LLCEKGKEGWNCRSLFGVALFRDSFSKVFVLQSTMRCLRHIKADYSPQKQETASIYLSHANYAILDAELNKNFNMSIKELSNTQKKQKKAVKVRVAHPERKITIREKTYTYSIKIQENIPEIDFELETIKYELYQRTVTEKRSLTSGISDKKAVISDKNDYEYTPYTLVAEIARFFPEIGPLKIEAILNCSKTGFEKILSTVNTYNKILCDRIIKKIFEALYEITSSPTETEREIVILKKPDTDYYLFNADPDFIAYSNDDLYKKLKSKSFHADPYCFDSKPEIQCFLQYLWSENVNEILFTGMFTSESQTELSIPYTDPESFRIRTYYPDFIAFMKDGTIRIIEVKGDNKLEDNVVKAKQEAAIALTKGSNIVYKILPASKIMKQNIVE
jgi:hypothetical protein